MPHTKSVVVIIGVGGMGIAAACRLGGGRHLILADFSSDALEAATRQLTDNGYAAESHQVDIADHASVTKLAVHAAERGHVAAIVHTTDLSPVMSSALRIYNVDLVGTANVIDAFADVVSQGSAMVCIASMAAHSASLPRDLETHLATAAVDRLLKCEGIDPEAHNPGTAYMISKRANILRVQAAAKSYGNRGARINSISPGIIATSMGMKELSGPSGNFMKAAVANSATQRMGTAHDIADAIAFLTGPDSSFITGTDLLVDGGCTAASRWQT